MTKLSSAQRSLLRTLYERGLMTVHESYKPGLKLMNLGFATGRRFGRHGALSLSITEAGQAAALSLKH